MRPATYSSISLSLIALLTTPLSIHASPFPSPTPTAHLLINRDCANPCGFYGQVCCQSSETCYTDANGQAACRTAAAAGGEGGEWEYFTTTYTQTDLVVVTSTGSRQVYPTSGSDQCKASLGETVCGDICCSAAQQCSSDNVCVEAGGSPWSSIPGPSVSPPVRPTSDVTITATVTPTTTIGFIPAISTDGATLIPPVGGGGGGLSGGAIAGIVIGALAGAFILLLLCLCLCAKGLIDTIFGCCCGPRRSGHSYSASSMSYSVSEGAGGGRVPHHHEESSGWKKWAGIGIVIGTVAVCLGLRRQKPPTEKSTTYYTGSYYYSSSESSSSSEGPRRGGGGPAGSGGGGHGGYGPRIVEDGSEVEEIRASARNYHSRSRSDHMA